MKNVEQTTSFKKDLKRYKNKKANLQKLYDAVEVLCKGGHLPPQMRPHILSGKLAGIWECHIENDSLLLWFEPDSNTLTLLRFGAHAELF